MMLMDLVDPCKKCKTPFHLESVSAIQRDGALLLYLHLNCVDCDSRKMFEFTIDGLKSVAEEVGIALYEEDPNRVQRIRDFLKEDCSTWETH